MSDLGAYTDEMGRFVGSDDELDRMFDGSAAGDRTRDLALFLADVKAAAMISMPGSKASEHVATISAEAARIAGQAALGAAQTDPEISIWRRTLDKNLPRLAKVGASVMAASMSMIGLAYAGVDLPGQAAERALEAVSGLELPNQGDAETGGKSVADDVKAVVESDAEKGCSFGQAVAGAARQNRQGEGGSDTDPCSAGGSGEGAAQGSRATGEENSAEGRAKAAEKSGGASEAGADNAADAGSQGDGSSGAGAENSAQGRTIAEEHVGGAGSDAPGSRDTGLDASTEGRAHAPFEVPGH